LVPVNTNTSNTPQSPNQQVSLLQNPISRYSQRKKT
jgi:hypothetical protein